MFRGGAATKFYADATELTDPKHRRSRKSEFEIYIFSFPITEKLKFTELLQRLQK
jgi:hypothetical protein